MISIISTLPEFSQQVSSTLPWGDWSISRAPGGAVAQFAEIIIHYLPGGAPCWHFRHEGQLSTGATLAEATPRRIQIPLPLEAAA